MICVRSTGQFSTTLRAHPSNQPVHLASWIVGAVPRPCSSTRAAFKFDEKFPSAIPLTRPASIRGLGPRQVQTFVRGELGSCALYSGPD